MALMRPLKLTHAQTILYESDMLTHSAGRLGETKWQIEKDQWIYLEAFLIHFRNLIEFFGHPAPREGDLTITKPEIIWPDESKRPASAELKSLNRPDLWDKYEGNQPHKISKYLHHCTKIRTEMKNWEVGAMYGELKPLLEQFEELLPNKTRTWDAPVKISLSTVFSASTASGPIVLNGLVL